ncbi:MAG: hypothetical protein V4603_00170 [Pseudomonadota bacterium]
MSALSNKRSAVDVALDVAAFVGLFIALILPHRLSWITLSSFGYLPLEAIVFGLLLLVPGRAGAWLRTLVALVLALGLVFKVSDLIAYQVFSRPFNPVFDAYLLADGMRLLTGAIGQLGAVLVALLLGLVFVVIFLLSFAVLGRIRAVLQLAPQRSLQGLSALLVLWVVLKMAGWPRVNTYFHDEFVLHVHAIVDSVADIKTFGATVNDDDYASVPGEQLFSKLRGKDVYVVFVESYGRIVLDDPEFAAGVLPTLEQASFQLQLNGLQARSAYLTSPTVGGISWLAHGTALSGLWINSQVRYDTLMMSERPTLNRLFKRAGWRTVAAMPAISMAWPEGEYFGYDHIYDSINSGYEGLPFNWVTMPDQYVLSALQAHERSSAHTPVMAEIALISSHAPWTPTPSLVPWDAVGDGTIFNAQTQAGPDVEAVWQDTALIREQYRKSIEYVINNLASYAIQYGDDDLVMIILGDHQPAPLVAGDTGNADVPVHIIARDPAVFDAIADWQWSEGLLPAADAPVWRMDSLRDRIIQAFSGSEAAADVQQ